MSRRIRHPQAERGLNFYQTPSVATRALIRAEELPHGLWEPHCGLGAIVELLLDAGHAVVATDLVDRGYPFQSGVGNFLKMKRCPPRVEGIVMNPPYLHPALHVQHALTLCPYVAALLPLTFLEAGNDKTEAGRARLFCLDRGHLARLYVFRERLPMMHREGWTGKRATSTKAYAWFVFDGDYQGEIITRRISIDRGADSAG